MRHLALAIVVLTLLSLPLPEGPSRAVASAVPPPEDSAAAASETPAAAAPAVARVSPDVLLAQERPPRHASDEFMRCITAQEAATMDAALA